jgi:hypothetical protein
LTVFKIKPNPQTSIGNRICKSKSIMTWWGKRNTIIRILLKETVSKSYIYI